MDKNDSGFHKFALKNQENPFYGLYNIIMPTRNQATIPGDGVGPLGLNIMDEQRKQDVENAHRS